MEGKWKDWMEVEKKWMRKNWINSSFNQSMSMEYEKFFFIEIKYKEMGNLSLV